jgi:putative membrane protein
MKKLLMTWVLNAASLPITVYLVNQFIPNGMTLDTSGGITAAVMLATVNTFIRPVLKFLTFPLTFLTLGLSSIALSIACLVAVDHYSDAFKINHWQAAIAGTLFLSMVSTVLNTMFNRK